MAHCHKAKEKSLVTETLPAGRKGNGRSSRFRHIGPSFAEITPIPRLAQRYVGTSNSHRELPSRTTLSILREIKRAIGHA
jgi:hypothetical protein